MPLNHASTLTDIRATVNGGQNENLYEIISRQTGAVPGLADSTEFAFTTKGVIIQ